MKLVKTLEERPFGKFSITIHIESVADLNQLYHLLGCWNVPELCGSKAEVIDFTRQLRELIKNN